MLDDIFLFDECLNSGRIYDLTQFYQRLNNTFFYYRLSNSSRKITFLYFSGLK